MKTLTRRERLERIMRHPVTDTVVMVLILVSIVLLVLGITLPAGTERARRVDIASHAITAVFAVELSLRYLAERNKRRFFEKFWIDCLAVLPAFRFFRFFWLLRLLRVFRFGVMLSRRLSGYSALFRSGAAESLVLAAVVTTLVLAGAIGVRMAEGEAMGFGTFESSLWWSVLSLVAGEPVGQTPTTTAGRIVTLGVMMSGLLVFAVITGVVSANMVDRLRRLDLRNLELEDLEGHVIICGWNAAAIRVIRELQADANYSRRGIVVIAEFASEPDIRDSVEYPALVFFLQGDPTRPDVLHRARIVHASRAIVLADRTRERSDQDLDARTVLTALLIENINREQSKDIFTSVELVNRDNAQSLISAGVEEIVVAHEYVGKILAASSRQVGMTPIIEELLTAQYGNQFVKIVLPASLPSMRVDELSGLLRQRAGAILVAVEDPDGSGGRMLVNPDDGLMVDGGSLAVVIARDAVDSRRLL